MTLINKEYVYTQFEVIPMDARSATGILLFSNNLQFKDELTFAEMDESEFSKITILLTVHNVNEAGKKVSVVAEVAYPLAKIHFRDNMPGSMKHNLQTGKRLKRVKALIISIRCFNYLSFPCFHYYFIHPFLKQFSSPSLWLKFFQKPTNHYPSNISPTPIQLQIHLELIHNT